MLNKVMVIGNLGQDAEAKYTSTGTAVANMSVAVNEKWKDKDGSPQERTEWVRVVIWGRTAEAIGEDREVRVQNGMFTDAFAGNGVHLYRIAEE